MLLSFSVSAQVIIKERVEIEPLKIPVSNNPTFNIDTSICNKFEYDPEIIVTDGDDKTYSVWYGDCSAIGFGGYNDCIHFDFNDDYWIVTIEEGFEYVQPRTSFLDCDGPYSDEGENFYIDYNYCLHLVFNKQGPGNMAQVKIKFANSTKVAHYSFEVYRPLFHITPTDTIELMEYGDYEVVDNYEVLNQCNTYWPWLPDTVSIIKEIIQGNEYCQLWNSNTNQYGTTFIGGGIYIVANGIRSEQDEEVIIRISTSESGIEPINLQYKVKPVELEITAIPSVLAPGDTATIIIQKKYQDGTIEDFPEWQGFEIAKVEGCALGEILVGGESGAYFYDVLQPIQFVVDSIAENGTVKLQIGVPKSPSFGTRPVKQKNTNTNQTNLADKQKQRQQTPPAENPILYCSAEIFESLLNNDFYLEVGDGCDKPEWACPVSIKRPKIDVKEINMSNCLEDEKNDIKSLCTGKYGFFHPIYDGPFWEPQFTVEPCFDSVKGIWQLNYNSDPIYIRAYTVFCPECVPESGIIRSLDDVWNKIPEDKLCKALEDFELQKKYGVDVEFIIEEQVMAHERLHKTDFFTAIAKTVYYYPENDVDKYNTTLLDTKYKCKDAPNYDVAIDKIQVYLDNVYQEFQKDLKKVYTFITGKDETIENETYETVSHDLYEVQSIIQDYIDEINNRIISINKSRTEELKIKCN